MLHVPDVKATVAWYQSLGFALRATHEEPGCPMDWAALTFGISEIMLSAGGVRASTPRRDVDLYIHTDDVDASFEATAGKAEVVEGLHQTEYGMREFIIKDFNGFWLTFGQSVEDYHAGTNATAQHPSDMQAALLYEQEEIVFRLGIDYFGRRDADEIGGWRRR